MSDSASARAHGEAVLSARIRSAPEDFVVDEIDAFEASGAGEHLLLTIEKRGMNTAFAAKRIAQWAGVAESAIGYAGLKDRHALTRQRFSVWIPKKIAPDIAALQSDDLRVLAHAWHARKLPRGALAGNRFALTVRGVAGDAGAIDERLRAIAARGVPNYFGEQRFGRGGDNVARAQAMFDGRRVSRHERSLLLSAARAQIFNDVLAARVRRGDWDRALAGDVWMLDGSHSIFGPEPLTPDLASRLAQGDVHPTGPLWGAGTLRSIADVAELEQAAAAARGGLARGLEAAGLAQERRSLRLVAQDVGFAWEEDALAVSFALPAGCYATTLLRELAEFELADSADPVQE